jgi:hypothetical protein
MRAYALMFWFYNADVLVTDYAKVGWRHVHLPIDANHHFLTDLI